MNREFHKWYSPRLHRDMELLVFGHAGTPTIVFPSSQGRFFEYEDRGMVGALAHKLEHGHLQLYCVDSVDSESWYNRSVHPRQRVERHMTYESYLLDEVVPLIRLKNGRRTPTSTRSRWSKNLPIYWPAIWFRSAIEVRSRC